MNLTARLAAALARIPGSTRTPSGLLVAPPAIQYACRATLYTATAATLAALVVFVPAAVQTGLGL